MLIVTVLCNTFPKYEVMVNCIYSYIIFYYVHPIFIHQYLKAKGLIIQDSRYKRKVIMNIQILGIVSIVFGIYILCLVLDKLSNETKCKIAITIKKSGPYLIGGVVSLWTLIGLFLSYPINKTKISMLINGSESFSEINQDSQLTIIAIILLSLGIVFYFLGRELYVRWICHKFIGV